MKRILLLCAFTLLFASQLLAQVDTAWTKTYGGAQADFGYYGEPLADGYIFVGETSSLGAGGRDIYLVRTDDSGDSIWTRTYGDTFDERGNCVIQTQDQGFVIAGFVEYGYDSAKVLLMKTASDGHMIWLNLFHPCGFLDYGYFVQQTADGGFIITGITYPGYIRQDAFLIKTDSLGNEEWTQTYGDEYGEHGYCVRQTNDGGYVVTGIYNADLYGGIGDVYLFKTDKDGNLQWQKDFGGSPTDAGYCVWQTTDGGFILTGQTGSYGDWDGDVYLMKTDSLGNQQWTPKYFGGNEWDRGRYMDITADGNYVIVGRTMSFGDPNGDIYLLKIDTLGTLLWQQTFGGSGIEFGSSIQQTSDGGFFITATTTSFGAGSWEAYILKTNPDAGVVEDIIPRDEKLEIGVPTFFRNEIRISLSHKLRMRFRVNLYTIAGTKLLEKWYSTCSQTVSIRSNELSRIPTGTYILTIDSGKDKLASAKVVKL